MSQPLTDWKMAPWPVPHGWAYVYDDMHSIERDVGGYTLIIGQDGAKWHWWLCPKGQGTSIDRGEGHDLLDALATHLGEAVPGLGPACKKHPGVLSG